MQSSIYVSDTPFFSITDKNGIFRMTGLKPGRYQFIANHKSFKRAEKEIDILPGKMINLNIDLEKLEEWEWYLFQVCDCVHIAKN